MKKYIISLMLLVGGILPIASNGANVHTIEGMHLKFNVTIENTATPCNSEGGKKAVFEPFSMVISNLIEQKRIQIMSDDLECLPNGDERYSFEAFIEIKKADSKLYMLLCDMLAKNPTNKMMLYKAIQEEFDTNARTRSAEVKAWGNQIIKALLSQVAQENTLSPYDQLYASLILNDYLDVEQEKTDIKIGAYLLDNLGCTLKINELDCKIGRFSPFKKPEPKVGATHLFENNKSKEYDCDCDMCIEEKEWEELTKN